VCLLIKLKMYHFDLAKKIYFPDDFSPSFFQIHGSKGMMYYSDWLYFFATCWEWILFPGIKPEISAMTNYPCYKKTPYNFRDLNLNDLKMNWTIKSKQFFKCFSEFWVENGIDDWIDAAVDVSKPCCDMKYNVTYK